MTSTDSLIIDLSADLRPVKRRNVPHEVLLLLGLAVVELVLFLLTAGMRVDMGQIILSPFMVWKVGSLAVLASVSCAVAIGSFTPPGLSRGGLRMVLGLAGLAAVAGMSTVPAADVGRPLLDRLAPAHGLMCAAAIIALSMPIMAMLGVLMRRAAPVIPKRSALAAGCAAATIGALIFTVRCPMNDPLYIIIWYSFGVATVSIIARWILPKRFRL